MSRVSGALFAAFVIGSLAVFATLEKRNLGGKHEDGEKAFKALFEKRLATTPFRVSPDSQTAFMLAAQEYGEPEEHVHEGSQFTNPMTAVDVWGYTRRRGMWFEERFRLGIRSRQIDAYTCRPLGLDDKGFDDKIGLRASKPPTQ